MVQGTTTGPVRGESIQDLLRAYATGASTPAETARRVSAGIRAAGDDGTWITVVPEESLVARAEALEATPGARELPLYGIPFAVKDSIDVAGLPTTLACPDYAYVPTRTAPVVQRLLAAGAMLVGKTNLDQFATGLNGTRTPYPVPRSVFGGGLVSGGSSSGSALAVAKGQVPFAVATDTAGSGRVPAALNGILGYKPSRGVLSTVGLVPACRSLDCMSLMATTTADLRRVLGVVAAVDHEDPWSRALPAAGSPADPAGVRVGLPDLAALEFFGDGGMRTAHAASRERVAELFPASVPADIWPFLAAGALLYQGPWVAERLVEFDGFLREHPESVLPVIRTILESGYRYSAVDAFTAQQKLQQLRAVVARAWEHMDVLVLPTIGTTFTVEQVLADPVDCNTALGHYTHFGNLLDLVAVAVPAGTTADGRPASLMVLGPALSDDAVLAVAACLAGEGAPEPAAAPTTPFVVVGHHLSGGPRNGELTSRGATLRETTTTSARYRLLCVGEAEPVPALLRTEGPGSAIEVEVWSVPTAALPGLLAGASPALDVGRVQLRDGREVPGFVCSGPVAAGPEGLAVEDISSTGGWRAHLAARTGPPVPAPGEHMPDLTLPSQAAPPPPMVDAAPGPFPLPTGKLALLVIDMQRDFLLPGGFGESLGNDVTLLQSVVPPLSRLLTAAREAGVLVIHTREGHEPDLSDCPPAKLRRGSPSKRIGDPGPYGRILVRGEYGHDILDELAPAPGEVVIDKPGKGAFYATDLGEVLHDAGVTHLLVTGVTTEVCVHTTVREANDRGFDALVVSDCVGSYFPEFHRVALEMVSAQGGIFGWVADSAAVLRALAAQPALPAPMSVPIGSAS